MSAYPPTVLGRTHSRTDSIGTATTATVSPKGKRKRLQQDDRESSSPESGEKGYEGDRERKRQPGVKRACNECRQQKLKCDVLTEPTYQTCSRCTRLKLACKIDSNFKRVGKRSRNLDMEREIVELRNQLARQQASSIGPSIKTSLSTSASPTISNLPSHMDRFMGQEQAVASSLMDLQSGTGAFARSPNNPLLLHRRIGDVILTHDRVVELFIVFFTYYHPFLPFLDPERSPDYYYEKVPLRFWIIISVAARRHDPQLLSALTQPLTDLLWRTLAEVPQNYIIVKALCILCTWPLPVSSTSSDATYLLTGTMMHLAMQLGLHRPSHTGDFSKFKEELLEEELTDRVRTWAACNGVAQRVATGYGQPPITLYDWTLAPSGPTESSHRLPAVVEGRLMIEKFCNEVTKALYSNQRNPVGLADDVQSSIYMAFLQRQYDELENKLKFDDSSITLLHLRAAGLHLRLFAFFNPPGSQQYHSDLMALWLATTSFLDAAFNLTTPVGNLLEYSTNYILQMITAAGFALLKLLNSFFASHINFEYGRSLFTRTIRAIRSISVRTNDLPSRLAEVLAQLWRASGAGSRQFSNGAMSIDNSLQLKVKCRMSMSLVFDSIWRWREEFPAKGKGNLDGELEYCLMPCKAPCFMGIVEHSDERATKAPTANAIYSCSKESHES